MAIISVDELCVAVENTLKEALPQVVALPQVQALIAGHGDDYRVKTWQQLPTVEALSTAQLPGVAITSPGMADIPKFKRSTDIWECRFRVAVGVYDRGRDHAETQARVRNWCAFIRTALQRNPSLGKVATGLDWVGEEYALLPRQEQARTIAAGAVAFDVAANVSNSLGIGLPSVTSTHSTVTVTPIGGIQ